MAYVNVGVQMDGSDIPTKKALKEAIADNPNNVVLYNTSRFDATFRLKLSQMTKTDKYSVTGPNPYNSRKWWATIAWSDKANKWVVS